MALVRVSGLRDRLKLEDRVSLLREAGADELEVHAPITSGGHRGRLVGRNSQLFFDDEVIADLARAAGYRLVERKGEWVRLERGESTEKPDSFWAEVVRAIPLLRDAEKIRHASPEEAVARMRALGRHREVRGPVGRARLRRAIGWLDAAMGENCFRRTLVELALDRGAAEEILVFGLDVGSTGHVAFKDSEARTFDVMFEIGP